MLTLITFIQNSIKNPSWEFHCGAAGWGSGIITAVAQVQSLAWQLPHAAGTAKGEKKSDKKKK